MGPQLGFEGQGRPWGNLLREGLEVKAWRNMEEPGDGVWHGVGPLTREQHEQSVEAGHYRDNPAEGFLVEPRQRIIYPVAGLGPEQCRGEVKRAGLCSRDLQQAEM